MFYQRKGGVVVVASKSLFLPPSVTPEETKKDEDQPKYSKEELDYINQRTMHITSEKEEMGTMEEARGRTQEMLLI